MQELQVEGMENLEKAESRGRGVLLLGSHLGAYAIRLAVLMRLGKPYTPVMFNPDDSPVPRYVRTMAEYGSNLGYDSCENSVIFAGEDAVSRIEERLNNKGKVCINFDVDGGFVVDFLGRPAAMASGIAHFVLNTGATIVPVSLQRGGDVFGHRLKLYEPLEYELDGDRRRDLNTIMTEVTRVGGEIIREAPGQWMSWFGLWQWWEKAAQIERKNAERPRKLVTVGKPSGSCDN
jgi:lauroyl/myristoyl acyltransferase